MHHTCWMYFGWMHLSWMYLGCVYLGLATVTLPTLIGCGEITPSQRNTAPVDAMATELDPDGPRIVVDEPFKDFGEVIAGTKVVNDFVFRNTGKATLKILRLKASCGCTAAVVSDREVPPGGEATIRLDYTAKGTGDFSNHVNVYHNAGGNAIRVDIVGTSRPALDAPPLIHLGQMHTGRRYERVVPLDIADGVALDIEAFGSTLPYIEARAERDGDDARLTVVFDGHPAPQAIDGWIWIDTDRPEDDRIVIPVRGSIAGDLQADPPRLYLGTVPTGRSVSKPVRVWAKGREVGDLEVELDGPDWVSHKIEKDGDDVVVTVSLSADAAGGRSVGRLKLRRAGEAWIEVPFHGYLTDRVQ